jgi:hypothetical protein
MSEDDLPNRLRTAASKWNGEYARPELLRGAAAKIEFLLQVQETIGKNADEILRQYKDAEERAINVRGDYIAVLDLLDDVSASAENMWLQFSGQMSPGDRAARRKVIHRARTICNKELRGEDTPPIEGEAKIAKELLAALEEAVEYIDTGEDGAGLVRKRARAAIAKARKETL